MSENPQRIGPFRIAGLLGHGGMGSVWRGEHVATGQVAAVKTVGDSSATDVQHIRREIRALAGLEHPGVVRIVAHGIEDGVPWFAMDLLDGVTLREHCNTSLPPTGRARCIAAATLVRRLCTPVGYLHGEGIVHRDLKPDNALITADETPIIIDFGLTSQFAGRQGRESLDAPTRAIGTLGYAAPEVLAGAEIDARADLYALGCFLYEAVGGRLPFAEATPDRQLAAQLARTRPAIADLAPDVPAGIARIIDWLLEPRAEDRIGHADTLAALLADEGADRWRRPSPRARSYLYRPRLAGRDNLLARIVRATVACARSGTGCVLLVRGESGIGKTRLLAEAARTARARNFAVLMSEVERSTAQLGGHLRAPLRAVADRFRTRGAAETARALGDKARLLSLFEPSIGTLPGLSDQAEPANLPPRAATLRLFSYFAELFEELCRAGPVVWVLDDLQWADETTLGLLEYLAQSQRLSRVPLVILGSYRPEEIGSALSDLSSLSDVDTFRLGRIDRPSITRMASDMLAGEVPATVTDEIARRSEGSPFFVAEYLRAGVARGVLVRDARGTWRLDAQTDPAAIPMPDSVRRLVAQRLDLLTPDGRDVAEAASVLGRQMSIPTLAAVFDSPEPVLEALGELVARQILEPLDNGRIGFLHDQVREATYAEINDEQRVELHRRCARALEGIGRAQDLATLAHHYREGGQVTEACRCYLRAARRAAKTGALKESGMLYREHLALVEPGSRDSAVARSELADSVSRILEPADRAVDDLQRALDESRRIAEQSLIARNLRALAMVEWRRGNLDAAAARAQEAITISHRIDDRSTEAASLQALASVRWREGALAESESLCQRALEIFETLADEWAAADVCSNLCAIDMTRGDYARGRQYLQRAIEGFERAGDVRMSAAVTVNLVWIEAREGDPTAALELGRSTATTLRDVGDYYSLRHLLEELSALGRRLGDVEAARGYIDEAERFARDERDPFGLFVAASQRALCSLAEGVRDDESITRARALGDEILLDGNTEMTQMREQLERAISAHDAGEPLIGGEVPADIPAAIVDYLKEHNAWRD